VALLSAVSGCGRSKTTTAADPGARPPVGAKAPAPDAGPVADLGFPAVATKNTIRVASTDPVPAAAAVARAVFPGTEAGTRPKAVTLVDAGDWRAALAAAALNAAPVQAPTLFTRGTTVPAETTAALKALAPAGSKAAGGAQVVRVGTTAAVGTLKTTDIKGGDPFAMARSIDAFVTAAQGRASGRVMVVSADDPAYAIPAAAYAAKSGAPILFTNRDSVPADTIAALKTHAGPKIYVVGPSSVISPKATKQLKKVGSVLRVGGQDPVSSAIAFARFSDEGFGWNIVDPGHGMVLLPKAADPALAAAAAPLSASGAYGPALLLSSPSVLDVPMRAFLLDIQPGYAKDPVRGVYNRAWLVGDTQAIGTALQAEIDRLLEITAIADKGTK
jgi:hypothetical protein